MKLYIIIFLILTLNSCTQRRIATTKYQVILNATPSFVKGGDNKGYIVSWQWRQIEGKGQTKNAKSPIAIYIVDGGLNKWELSTWDNLGIITKDTISVNTQ